VTRAGQMIEYGQIGPPSGTPLGSPESAILCPFVAGRPASVVPCRLKALLALWTVGLALVSNLHCIGWRKGAK